MKFLFNHQNFNVLDLEKSIAFYEEALGLTVNRTVLIKLLTAPLS